MILKFDTRGNSKQRECVKAWIDPEVTEILFGGAKGGSKSFTGCKLIFGDALIYPDTSYFIARKKLNDLRKFTIPSIHECFSDWGIDMQKYAKFNGQDNFYQLHNGSKVFLLEVAYQPGDPLFTRFGSLQFSRGWGEEVGEWEEAAANNLQASIGRWNNIKYNLAPKFLMTCNPSKNFLYRKYYKAWKEGSLKSWQRFIQALPTDNKMLSPEYITNLERALNKSEKERLLYGSWEYLDDPAALIDYEKILDCFTNTHVPEGDRFISSDIARLGGDKIVIIEWSGFRGKVKHFSRQTLDVTTTQISAAMIRNQTGHSNVIVDSDGLGGGPVDMLRVKGFTNNARALPAPNPEYDAKGNPINENFDNIKSQCSFRMAERINKNGLYLECETDEVKQWIIEEMEQVKQKLLDSDMKKGVMPKDKIKEVLGRSPDFWDCFIAGTKILTPTGEKNIEDICIGDLVVTPNGNRKVMETIKKKASIIYGINDEIYCTGNHRFVTNNGLISADTLTINDYLYKVSIYHLWSWRLKKLLSIKGKNIGFLKQILNTTTQTLDSLENEKKLDCINKFSSIHTDQSHADTTFTTLMKTLSTTILLMWLQLKEASTGVNIRLKEWLTPFVQPRTWKCLKNILIKLGNGINQMRETSGIERMVLSHGLIGNLRIEHANVAANNFKVCAPMQNTVQIIVPKDRDIRTKKDLRQGFVHNAKTNTASVRMKNPCAATVSAPVYLDEPTDVYTLTVEKDHVYYANGYLVENCIMMREIFELKPIRVFSDADY